MLKLVLLALVAVCTAQWIEVKITYDPPVLRLTLPIFDKEIGGVVFTYYIRNVENRANGIQTSEGYEYRADVKLDSTPVYAYAQIYDKRGNLKETTGKSSFTYTRNAIAAFPQSRRIRSVIFRDDFNSFNRLDWYHEVSMYGGMNWEFQVYTNLQRNVYTQNGKLFLKPTLTTDDPRFDENYLHTGRMDMTELFKMCTNTAYSGCTREGKNGILPPVMSGKISSTPTIRYGVVEIRAKIPKGDWLWPAIWMLPKNNKYGGWPRSGEIDIMEARGNDGPLGVETVSSTLHWGPSFDRNQYELTHGEAHRNASSAWHEDFHTWRLEWTPEHIITFVDDEEIMRVTPGAGFWQKGNLTGDDIWASGSKMAPFDHEYYLILNVAVGAANGYFPDNATWVPRKPWSDGSPHAAEDFWNARNEWLPSWQGDHVAMQIDYVEFRYL